MSDIKNFKDKLLERNKEYKRYIKNCLLYYNKPFFPEFKKSFIKNNKKKSNSLLKEQRIKNKSAFIVKKFNEDSNFLGKNYRINGGNYERDNNYSSNKNKTLKIYNIDKNSENIKREINNYEAYKKKYYKTIDINGNTNNNNYNNNFIYDINSNNTIKKKNGHLISKINTNKSNKIINKNYYILRNYPNYKSSNNILEGNDIFNTIKNINNYKIKKKGWKIKNKEYKSQDNNKSQVNSINKNLYENEYKNIKNIKNINNNNTKSKSYKQNIYLINKNENKDKDNDKDNDKNNKKIENGSTIKEEKVFSDPIIRVLFNKENKNKKGVNNSIIYTPFLDKFKSGTITINNNANYIKYGYTFKGDKFFEYQNQLFK